MYQRISTSANADANHVGNRSLNMHTGHADRGIGRLIGNRIDARGGILDDQRRTATPIKIERLTRAKRLHELTEFFKRRPTAMSLPPINRNE